MTSNGWIERVVPLILRSRWPTLAVVAVVTGLAGWFATRVTIDTSLETWFVEDDQSLANYQEFRRQFGEDEFIVMALEADDVFGPELLDEVARLTEAAGEVPGVRRVTSLTNVRLFRRRGDSAVAGRLISGLPLSSDEAAELRDVATSHPMLVGNLVAADAEATAIIVRLSRACDTFAKKAAVVRELRRIGREVPDDVQFRLAGTPVVNDAISAYTRRDLNVLTPLAYAVVAVCALLLFGRISVALISLSVVGLTTLWVIGLMGAFGLQMNLLAPVLVMIVLVVGVADVIHIFAAYFQAADDSDEPAAAMDRALRHVLLPCLITSLTTAIGFLSLLASDLEPIREFGALAAGGTVLAFVLGVFFVPATLPLVGTTSDRVPTRETGGPMNRLLALLGRPTRRVSLAVLAASGMILVPAAWSIRYIEISANPLKYFRPDDPVRLDAEAIESALGGAASIEFIVRAPHQGLKNLDVLRRLDLFEVWLEGLPSVTRVDSLGSLLKEVDRVDSGRSQGALPRRQRELPIERMVLQRAAPDLVSRYVEENSSLGRISARVVAAEADRLAALAPEIERIIREEINNDQVTVMPTGFVILIDAMRDYLIRSQVRSVLLAFGTITLVLLVLFRSWKLALFSLIPNVGPIVLGLALMVVTGIPLDSGTVMIATIALGLVVDDTCHFLVGLRRHTAANKPIGEAIAATMSQVGRPIILTSIILAAGFSTVALGSFEPTTCFGAISAAVLIAALVADLVVLPAALLVLRPKL